jgi:hypothetical protein
VDDTLLMDVGKTGEDLHDDWKADPAADPVFEEFSQGVSAYSLDHHVEHIFVLAHVVNGDDIWMLQAKEDPDLAVDTSAERRVSRQMGGQSLYGNVHSHGVVAPEIDSPGRPSHDAQDPVTPNLSGKAHRAHPRIIAG